MVIIALAMYANYTWKQSEDFYGPTTISVIGKGEVVAVPDIGQFSFSVEAEGAEANVAQTESATKVNAILAYLEEAGVSESDVRTQNYSLYPKYRYEQRICPQGSYCPGEQVPDGFSVSQTVEVKVRDLDQAGDLIAGVGNLEATNISGLNFTIDDVSALNAEARATAIADAEAQAKVLAKQLGVRIEKMTGYYENEGVYPERYYGMGGDMAMDQSVKMISPEMPVGENTVASQVTLTYQVR